MLVLGQVPTLADGATPLIEGVYGAAKGVKVTALNNAPFEQVLTVQVLCGSFQPEYGSEVVVGVVNITTKSGGSGEARGRPGFSVTGGGYDSSGLETLFQHPDWQGGPALSERPDGIYGAPDVWRATFYNHTAGTQSARIYAYTVGDIDSLLRTHVVSLSLETNERRVLGISLPLNDYSLGNGGFSASSVRPVADAVWRPANDPTARGFGFTASPDQYRIGPGGISGKVLINAPFQFSAKATATVKLAVIAAPSDDAARPTNIVPAVEYYNADRDHYFVTSIRQEISDLDSGVHPGWQRTNQTFNVYAAGSGGPLGRLPFCRYYGLPEAGLDSHFYTGSVLECLDVLAKFAGAWQLESGEVFQAHLPNIVTGACPAGTVPVLRTWNQRVDSNHRYTTSIVLRNQMLAQGHVAEGYGPDGVAFCAPA